MARRRERERANTEWSLQGFYSAERLFADAHPFGVAVAMLLRSAQLSLHVAGAQRRYTQ
jgi:hypothetical protein